MRLRQRLYSSSCTTTLYAARARQSVIGGYVYFAAVYIGIYYRIIQLYIIDYIVCTGAYLSTGCKFNVLRFSGDDNEIILFILGYSDIRIIHGRSTKRHRLTVVKY